MANNKLNKNKQKNSWYSCLWLWSKWTKFCEIHDNKMCVWNGTYGENLIDKPIHTLNGIYNFYDNKKHNNNIENMDMVLFAFDYDKLDKNSADLVILDDKMSKLKKSNN